VHSNAKHTHTHTHTHGSPSTSKPGQAEIVYTMRVLWLRTGNRNRENSTIRSETEARWPGQWWIHPSGVQGVSQTAVAAVVDGFLRPDAHSVAHGSRVSRVTRYWSIPVTIPTAPESARTGTCVRVRPFVPSDDSVRTVNCVRVRDDSVRRWLALMITT
jgi:hypothetical protein